jgi:Response regulator containing a CheY-like receiver domain and an HTH DNA-binding domain
MNVSSSVLSDDPFFIQGLYSLLSKELVDDSFIVLDLDGFSYEGAIDLTSCNREIVAFASNDLAFYKAEQFGSFTVLDKKSSLKSILDYFLFKRSSGAYHIKRNLTQREKQMLGLIRDGVSSQEIALQLGIKHKTLYTYRRNLMIKLGCENRILFQNLIFHQ